MVPEIGSQNSPLLQTHEITTLNRRGTRLGHRRNSQRPNWQFGHNGWLQRKSRAKSRRFLNQIACRTLLGLTPSIFDPFDFLK